MDNTNLIIVGLMFIVVVVAQFIQANMLIAKFEKLEQRILARLGAVVIDVEHDLPPWETKPHIDERERSSYNTPLLLGST